MKVKDFDAQFDAGKDITHYLDVEKLERPGLAQKRVNVDFPQWMIDRLDEEADRIGVTRQSVIKFVIAEHLEKQAANTMAFSSMTKATSKNP